MNKNADYRDAKHQNGQTEQEIADDAIGESEPVSPKEELAGILATLRESCQDAIDGNWNRSDEGFQSMIEHAKRGLEILKKL